MASAPETTIGVWRGSKANLQFWLQTILTLSLYYWLVYQYNDITLTTDRLTQRRGNMFTSNQATLTLDSITDISVNKSFLGGVFNYGDMFIMTAGSRQSEIRAWRLANPDGLRDAIFRLRGSP